MLVFGQKGKIFEVYKRNFGVEDTDDYCMIIERYSINLETDLVNLSGCYESILSNNRTANVPITIQRILYA